MMRNFTDEDFDEFLRRNADEFRMRPSFKVWQNISGHLKERKRRFLLTTLGFVLMTGAVGYFVYESTDKIQPASAIVKAGPPETPTPTTETAGRPAAKENTGYNVPGTQSPAIGPVSRGSLSVVSRNPNIITRNQNNTTANRIRNILTTVPAAPVAETTESVSLNKPEGSEFVPQVIDSDPELTVTNTSAPVTENTIAQDPMTIESVVNTYRLANRNGKLAMQVFFTPTVSYRKLSENKRYTAQPAASNGTNYPAIYSINDAVTHKPDMGLELGLTAKYTVDRNIKLRGGVQFNMSRYDIKAYTYTSELATIALGRGGSGSVEHMDHISSHRNFDGNKPHWLQNMYFQVSAPMGLEMKLSGNDKASFGVASTLQPSYMLGERAYMLSSDYKNYTKVPELVRRWNVATNLETFVSYSTGDVKWQVGPQVRYQLFSSFVSKYPVKEHLFDFGLKVGVSLNRKKTESNIK